MSLLFAGAVRPALAGDTSAREQAEQDLNQRRRQAIRNGCDYIAKHCHRGGSFGDEKAMVAFTALSALALMADGSGMDRGPYGAQVSLAVRFLVSRVQTGRDSRVPEGFFFTPGDNNSKMHGQGYATLALASALGTADATSAAEIRTVLRKAVDRCQKSQTGTGGWGYDPSPEGEHEGSVTVTIAQGLRAARDAGILVDANAIRRGLDYLKKSQKDDGSFKYSITTDRSSYALTAAAVSSFYLFGAYARSDDLTRAVERGIQYVHDNLPMQLKNRDWFYYGNFYAAWAAWQKDGDDPDPGSGSFWGHWHSIVYPVLLEQQGNDGSWTDPVDRFAFGPLLATAFAVLTLAIPDEQLPIFQR